MLGKCICGGTIWREVDGRAVCEACHRGHPDLHQQPVIAEGIHGTWRYHLALPGLHHAICEARVMPTQIPLDAWGRTSHLNERWCKTCAELRGDVLRIRQAFAKLHTE